MKPQLGPPAAFAAHYELWEALELEDVVTLRSQH